MSDSRSDNPLQERLNTALEYLIDLVNNPYYVLIEIAQTPVNKLGRGHYFYVLVGKFPLPEQAQKYATKARSQVNKGWRLKKVNGVKVKLVFTIRVIRQFELVEQGHGRFFDPPKKADWLLREPRYERYERYERDAAPTMGTLYRAKIGQIMDQHYFGSQYSSHWNLFRYLDEPVVKVGVVGAPVGVEPQFVVDFASLDSANQYVEELRQAAAELGGDVAFNFSAAHPQLRESASPLSLFTSEMPPRLLLQCMSTCEKMRPHLDLISVAFRDVALMPSGSRVIFSGEAYDIHLETSVYFYPNLVITPHQSNERLVLYMPNLGFCFQNCSLDDLIAINERLASVQPSCDQSSTFPHL